MTADSAHNPLDDSLDLVEWLMERDEEFSVELTEDDVERLMRNGATKDDLERWMRGVTPMSEPRRSLPHHANSRRSYHRAIMDESKHTETGTDRTRELANRLFSYRYLHDHDLLKEPPPGDWPATEDVDDDPDGNPDGNDGGPPYAGAMAMPRPYTGNAPFKSYPARVIRRKRRATG